MPSLILRTATRLLVSMILVFSVYLLLRGHNAPGGGFAGALVAGTGFALYIMAEGSTSVRRAIRIDPRRLIVFGMGLALVSGLAGIFAGRPFLTGLWWTIAEINGKEIVVGTPLFFDIGVFAIVLGMILTLILALEEN
ncbi:MAG: Na+/H+ antiporter subunit B [Desulfobacterales bacterium]|nr:Na+/H+ antiporter subunit B [Desulfobacterales bacterium]